MKTGVKSLQYFLSIPFLVLLLFLTGCAREPALSEKILGGWSNKSAETYIYLTIKMENKWEASVKIADFTSNIIQARGKASGQWHIEDNTFVLTVFETDIEKIFKKNSTGFFEIIKLDDKVLELMDTNGQIIVWKTVQIPKNQAGGNSVNSIRMAPFTVNLNKVRSRDKDRYLCLNLKIILKEFMPGAQLPKVHPKAREAVLIYLSSLVYKDIKDLSKVKELQNNLRIVLNPYMGDMVEKVEIDHVIVSSTIDRVEEFLIEHSLKARISQKRDGKDDKENKADKKEKASK